TLGASSTLTSTSSGDISFLSTLGGGFDLTVNTGGTTTFGGVVGGGGAALARLTTDAAGATHVNTTAITTTAAQLYQDDVTLGASAGFVTSRGDLVFGGAVNADNATNHRTLALTAGAGNLRFTGAVGGGQSLQSLTVNSAANVAFDSTVNTGGDV